MQSLIRHRMLFSIANRVSVVNVESGSHVSQVRVVQLWDVSSGRLTKVC